MTITVEATYANGVLKLTEPLPLKENEQVRVTIQADGTWADRAAGHLQWTGSVEDLDYLIDDVENDPLEAP